MDITIYQSFLPHTDLDTSLAFYRDTLGFEVRNDVEYGGMHWLTVGPTGQSGTSIVLYPPAATPGLTDDERRTIHEMMAKGIYATLILATKDLDSTPRPCWQPSPHPGGAPRWLRRSLQRKARRSPPLDSQTRNKLR